MNSGLIEDYAHTIAENLIDAEMRGHSSHGLSRCNFYLDKFDGGGFNRNPDIQILRERLSSIVVDGDRGPGAVIGKLVMEKCIEKAKKTGVCVGVARNSNHNGIAAYYTKMALAQDMIGLSGCNSVPYVCPYGGIDPLMGTNPISFAFPTNKEIPFLFDGATSVVSQGKIIVATKENKKIPITWGMDREGNPSDDPTKVLNGMMRAFGEYKGSALAMFVDLMSASLSAASFSMDVKPLRGEPDQCQGVGQFYIAIDVDAFRDVGEFKNQVDEFVRRVKGSKVDSGFEEILLPGEMEHRKEDKARSEGFYVGAGVMTEISGLADKYNVKNRSIFE